ncbi:MAG: GTP cyclohydrolase FolE2 [Vampirovibrionales bacterium]|jgi:GTP cyclohydrolase I|nr:GTP cyclohydrolase FolE2 [Vampirovibrionales bacterium]
MIHATVLDPLNSPDLLEDVQGRNDERNIALQAAGVSHVEMPLQFLLASGCLQAINAQVSMSVSLLPEEKGTHMSRFIEQVADWSKTAHPITLDLRPFLVELRERLKAESATAEIQFKLFLDKKAPVTENSAPMGYDCTLSGVNNHGKVTLFAKVEVPMATLCPCSKAISDFGAHNQRAIAILDVALDEDQLDALSLETLIKHAEESASCAVYPLLKRADEKWVTERQYSNAKFVEDVVRDLTLALRQQVGIRGFSIRVTALESIHAHNAWASHAENMPQKPSF